MDSITIGKELLANDRDMVNTAGHGLHKIWQDQFRIDNPSEITRPKKTSDEN